MVKRQSNFLGQQRVDVPHLRALESSVAADFDLLAGKVMAGDTPQIIRGFNIVTTGAIGLAASSLQLAVAGGVVFHPKASESGTMLSVSDDAAVETLSASNTKVTGAFTANTVNYVGLDLTRSADDTTSDLVMFLDASTLLEVPKTVPLARTLSYKIVISTTDFSATSHIAPIAKITTNASNIVTAIEDARDMYFRLGKGGSVPDNQYVYGWPDGRKEKTASGEDVFSGGDKAIGSDKDWRDAAMTRIWEIGGGEYWYSATADRNVTFIWTGTTFDNGENFEWVDESGTFHLHWKGLRFLFDNSTATYNDVKDQAASSAGLTDLADGECIYVDLDRTTDRTGGTAIVPQKASLATLGQGTPPGSRYILAWRSGADVYTRNWRYKVGATFEPATTTSLGVVQLSATPGSASNPKVVALDASNLGQAAGLTRGAVGAGALTIGTGANDSSITLGKSGATATLAGHAVVSGTLKANTIDPDSGAITIGGTNATGITAGRAGITLTVPGTLSVNTIDAASGDLTLKDNVIVDNTVQTINRDAIVTAETLGLKLYNNTASTSGVQEQFSPALAFRGSRWTGSVSQTEDWVIQGQPKSVGAEASLVLKHGVIGTSTSELFKFLKNGRLQFTTTDVNGGGLTSTGRIVFRSGLSASNTGIDFLFDTDNLRSDGTLFSLKKANNEVFKIEPDGDVTVTGALAVTGDVSAAGGFRSWVERTRYVADISATTATFYTLYQAEMDDSGTKRLVGDNWRAPRAGSITALYIHFNQTVTSGTLTLQVQKNESDFTNVKLDVTSGTGGQVTFAKDTHTFAAGDRLRIVVKTSSLAPSGAGVDYNFGAGVEIET